MVNEEDLYKIIQKANQEQTEKISEANEAQINTLREEIRRCFKEVDTKIEKNCTDIYKLTVKNLEHERRIRRNNIVIYGLENVPKEYLLQNCLDELNRLLELEIVEKDVNTIYQLGKNAKPPIVIELISLLKKQKIFSRVTKLKGTGVTIANDLCFEDREDQKTLRKHLNKAKKQNSSAKIKGNKLIINGKAYTCNELKQLEEGNNLIDQNVIQETDTDDDDQDGAENPSSSREPRQNLDVKGKIKNNSASKTGTAGGKVFTRSRKQK